MCNAAEHAFKEKSAKLLILLSLRTIYFRKFQCETPCNNHDLEIQECFYYLGMGGGQFFDRFLRVFLTTRLQSSMPNKRNFHLTFISYCKPSSFQITSSLQHYLKFGYLEKASKFEKIFHIKFDFPEQLQILSGRFFFKFCYSILKNLRKS